MNTEKCPFWYLLGLKLFEALHNALKLSSEIVCITTFPQKLANFTENKCLTFARCSLTATKSMYSTSIAPSHITNKENNFYFATANRSAKILKTIFYEY